MLVLMFGAKRLPDMAKSVGQSMKIFKNEMKDLREDTPTAPSAPPADPTPSDKV
ncbi:MAG: twin-arginine translocase TatA/TatE family subunit [Cellulomonas sp.]